MPVVIVEVADYSGRVAILITTRCNLPRTARSSKLIKSANCAHFSAIPLNSRLQDCPSPVLADRLNSNAANSLLKTLEEPPGNSLLLLVTAQSGAGLPATVRSRCQVVISVCRRWKWQFPGWQRG
ncbi:MAG: hypothetical protein U1F42_05115 [Candidatus Competibacteraceae bacterium]